MVEIKDAAALRRLADVFEPVEQTPIFSALQGRMGRAFADNAQTPRCGQVKLHIFSFFAGDAHAPGAKALVENMEGWALAVPQNEAWGELIRSVHGPACEKITRYAIKKEPGCFDAARLAALRDSLPPGYRLCPIGQELYSRCLSGDWSRDFCSNFPTWEDYSQNGVGFCIMLGDELVAGASSFSVYNGGIEIEIHTREDHRRRGLAAACAAELILECLKRGLYPSWDAANPASVKLCEKLGYHFSHEYDTYVVKPRDEA